MGWSGCVDIICLYGFIPGALSPLHRNLRYYFERYILSHRMVGYYVIQGKGTSCIDFLEMEIW